MHMRREIRIAQIKMNRNKLDRRTKSPNTTIPNHNEWRNVICLLGKRKKYENEKQKLLTSEEGAATDNVFRKVQ